MSHSKQLGGFPTSGVFGFRQTLARGRYADPELPTRRVRCMNVASGFIRIVTTDLTKIEVAKHHEQGSRANWTTRPRPIQEIGQAALDVDLPEISAEDLRKKIFDRYFAATEHIFQRLTAKTLPMDDVNTPTTSPPQARSLLTGMAPPLDLQ